MAIQSAKINWWDKVKHAVARYLLAGEVSKVNLERSTFLRLQEELGRNHKEFEDHRASVTITDMVREQLAGFNPKLLETEDDLPEILGEVEEQDQFLVKIKGLAEHKEMNILIDYLVRNQVLFTAKEAGGLDAINFGRATINGLALFKEEVQRLATIYTERHAGKEEFDEHEVV